MDEFKGCDALTLYGGSFSANFTIDEKDCLGALLPDGERVAYISSNYGEFYHFDWEHLRKVEKEKTSTRGRKKNPPPPRKKDRKGSGEKFDSCITFVVIVNGVGYGIKIFRINSLNIYSIKGRHFDLANQVVSTLFDFINQRIPDMDARLTHIDIDLHNMRFRYPLPVEYNDNPPAIDPKAEPDPRVTIGMTWNVNIHILREIISNQDICQITIDGHVYNALIVYTQESPLRLMFKKGETTYHANLSYSGKLFVYGGKEASICIAIRDFIFGLIDANRDTVVQQGILAMKGCDKKALRQIAAAKLTAVKPA